MNRPSYFVKSVSALLVAVILITAFTREPLKLYLLGAALAAWAIPLIVRTVRRRQSNGETTRPRRRMRTIPLNCVIGSSVRETVLDAYTTEHTLLRHVNHRISAYLRAVYPNATWEWETGHPELIAADGGTGRIKLYDVDDYTHADVTLDRNAHITCDLLRIMRMGPDSNATADPTAWFNLRGKAVLEQISEDLASRGYTELSIRDNGDIFIRKPEGEVMIDTLGNFPDRLHWPRLIEAIEGDGYNVSVSHNSLGVSWSSERSEI